MANEIKSKDGWERFCTIQFEEATDWRNDNWAIRMLSQPRLWNKKAFQSDSQKQLLAKQYSHKRIITQRLFDANVRIIKRVVTQELAVEGEGARSLAYQLLKNNKHQQIKALGVTKLLTKEEEL